MIPSSIQNKLAGLRRRERLLTFVWGAACWLSIVLVLLLLCGLADWLIDRQRDTPLSVRYGMFYVQLAVAAVAGLLFVFWPQVRRLPDALMALWVEAKIPQFEHRLISAVQLNQPGAQLDGMSRELVGVVTREAEVQAQRVGGFAQVADHSRLKWTALVLTPLALLVALPFILWPEVSFALLQRQAMQDVDMPHSVTLESAAPEYWPIGEDIPIQYHVRGAYDKDMIGTLFVTPEGQPTDRYELKYLSPAQDGNGAIFGTYVHPSSVNVTYSARLVDGRTKLPSTMHIVPRPIVTENMAWVLLPAYCGLRPLRPGMSIEERRYEMPQGRGDVAGIPNSSVRVQVKVQKEIAEAWLELLSTEIADKKKLDDVPDLANEKPLALRQMTVGSDGMSAEIKFDLAEGLTGYRVIVKDKHGFPNTPPPRRSVRLVPEEPPQVALLRDTFVDVKDSRADFDLEGLPVVIGGEIRIPYVCFGNYGLGKAQVLYRVLKKQESGEEPMVDEEWIRGNLPEIPANPSAGPFDTKTGVFKYTEFDQQVEFHAVPSLNPDKILGRTSGGGRYFLKTTGLLDTKTGKALKLKSGDQIEYCIKVYAAHREPESSVPFAVSESRVSTVMTLSEYLAWQSQIIQEDERVKDLERKQKGVFAPK